MSTIIRRLSHKLFRELLPFVKLYSGNIVSRNVLILGIPSPFVIVLTLWSLLLGPGAVPTDTTLSNRMRLVGAATARAARVVWLLVLQPNGCWFMAAARDDDDDGSGVVGMAMVAAMVVAVAYAARIEADRLLAARLQEEERETLQLKREPNFFMILLLFKGGGKKHADLKNKNFEEIQVLYKKVKRSDKNFIAIGSTEDERQIKELNEESKDPKKKRVVNEIPREEDTTKVPAEQEVTEQGTKKRKSGYVKMIAKKRPRPQPDDDSDDEHRKCLRIATFDSTLDSEIMEIKSFVSKLHKVSSPDGDYLIVYRVNGHFRAFNYQMEVLHIFDRHDLFHLYDLVMKQYLKMTPEGIELILWGDLKIMMESSTEEIDQDHNLWDVIVNGDLEEEPALTGETSAPPAPKTAKQLAAKRNQERVKSILLLAIPDLYLLKFINLFEDVITKIIDYCLFDVVVGFHRCNLGRFSDEPLFEYVYGGSLQAQSIVFIDELDAVGKERGLIKGSGGKEHDATLNQATRLRQYQKQQQGVQHQSQNVNMNNPWMPDAPNTMRQKIIYHSVIPTSRYGNNYVNLRWYMLLQGVIVYDYELNMRWGVDATKAKLLEICRFGRNVGDGNMGTGMLPVPYDMGGIC
ncbi:hypothetical protein Tco_0226713 [Tanacetum coccineum]